MLWHMLPVQSFMRPIDSACSSDGLLTATAELPQTNSKLSQTVLHTVSHSAPCTHANTADQHDTNQPIGIIVNLDSPLPSIGPSFRIKSSITHLSFQTLRPNAVRSNSSTIHQTFHERLLAKLSANKPHFNLALQGSIQTWSSWLSTTAAFSTTRPPLPPMLILISRPGACLTLGSPQ